MVGLAVRRAIVRDRAATTTAPFGAPPFSVAADFPSESLKSWTAAFDELLFVSYGFPLAGW
jgi:hypothetical protein